MAMKAYKSYKDTDQFWLKQIPSHWDIHKIKYVFNERSEKGHPEEPLLVSSQNMGVVPKSVYGNRTVEAMKGLDTLKLVKVGDFVISLRSFQGGIEYAYYQGIISPAYTIMILKGHVTPEYFRHLAKSDAFIKLLKLCVTGIREGQNINYTLLRNYRIPVPPKEEQDQIVRYLDWQNSRLNKLINAKKKEIALLEEQKQALISQAVTKGLDPNAPLKDSGIDYIGYIPKHWRVLQNRRLYSSVSRKYSDKQLVLSLSQKDGLIPYENMSERSLHTSSYDNWKLVLENDLVLNRFKAHLGVFFASDYNGIVTFHYGVYEPKFPIISKFYEALYHTESYKCAYAGQSRGMTVGLQNLSDTDFYSIYTVYPPYKEQIKISNYIKRLEYSFSKYREQLTQYISLLQEYRTRLVADVVTGQIDVRNIAIPNYETVTETIDQPETDENENNIVEK